MSPVNTKTCRLLQHSGPTKTFSLNQCFRKLIPTNTNLSSILKPVQQSRKITMTKKRVRFAVPLEEQSATTDHLSQIDKVRSKMATIRKSLRVKQRTVVGKVTSKIRKVIPSETSDTNSKKAFLHNNKSYSMHTRDTNSIETQPVSTILQPRKLLRNDLNYANMKMMQCKDCSSKAYLSIEQQTTPTGNSNSFICTECFQKANSMVLETSRTCVPNAAKAAVSTNNSKIQLCDPLEDIPIIISNVRSLSTQNQHSMGTTNLEAISPSLQNEQMEETPVTNDNTIASLSADLDVKIEKEETAQEKEVKVRASEGYFTFIVPNDFEDQTDKFKLASGQTSGTADDPIVVDDN